MFSLKERKAMSQKIEVVVKNGHQVFSLESYLKACDTCPFLDECESYREAFGSSECLRDDYGRALLDFLKDSRKERMI